MGHKHAEVLRAIADGREVQVKILNEWTDSLIGTPFVKKIATDPISHPDLEWRVKPKPPIVQEVCVYLTEENIFVVKQFRPSNTRFTFDPDTKMPIKVELI